MAGRDTAARRYAEAAFEVAVRDDAVERWRSDLDTAAAVVADPDVGRALANPAVPAQVRLASVETALGRTILPGTMNLIGLLVRRGRIEQLPRVSAEFRRLDNARQGITVATATSAAALTPEEIRELTGKLEEMSGGRIELDVQVDPSLLGGLVVRVGDRLIDGSVRGRLERLRNQLTAGAF